MKNFVKIMVAAIMATGMAMVLMAHDVNGKAVVCVYFCVGIMTAALLGVFDDNRKRGKTKYGSIRHKYGFRKAA